MCFEVRGHVPEVPLVRLLPCPPDLSSPPSSSIYAGAQEIQFMTWFVHLSSSGTSFAQTLIEERPEIVLFKQSVI